jgi:hypothetical protein
MAHCSHHLQATSLTTLDGVPLHVAPFNPAAVRPNIANFPFQASSTDMGNLFFMGLAAGYKQGVDLN